MTEDIIATLTDLTQKLMQNMDIQAAVTVTASEDDTHLVTIEAPEEGGMLIGRHGRSLEAIQTLLGQMLFKTTGEWHRIVVSVGDYRERREEQLKQLAATSAARAVATGEPVPILDLSPSERRVIHMVLSEHPDVVSESEGEGRDRHLVIKPKT